MKRSLAKALEKLQQGAAGLEDPFAGIPPELDEAFLYGVGSTWWNGWDGMNAGRIKIHGDGHGTAHVGPCTIAPVEALHERLIRVCGLDRDEAALVRDAVAHPGGGNDTAALRLQVSVRTYQRREQAIRAKLRRWRVEFVRVEELA